MTISIGGFSFWKCAAAVTGGGILGFASGTGNGVAFLLGPVGATWGAIAMVGGALAGASQGCFD